MSRRWDKNRIRAKQHLRDWPLPQWRMLCETELWTLRVGLIRPSEDFLHFTTNNRCSLRLRCCWFGFQIGARKIAASLFVRWRDLCKWSEESSVEDLSSEFDNWRGGVTMGRAWAVGVGGVREAPCWFFIFFKKLLKTSLPSSGTAEESFSFSSSSGMGFPRFHLDLRYFSKPWRSLYLPGAKWKFPV